MEQIFTISTGCIVNNSSQLNRSCAGMVHAPSKHHCATTAAQNSPLGNSFESSANAHDLKLVVGQRYRVEITHRSDSQKQT